MPRVKREETKKEVVVPVMVERFVNVLTLTDEQAMMLNRFRLMGTLSQEQALEYHNLLNKLGE